LISGRREGGRELVKVGGGIGNSAVKGEKMKQNNKKRKRRERVN